MKPYNFLFFVLIPMLTFAFAFLSYCENAQAATSYDGKITVICPRCKITVPPKGVTREIRTRTVLKANIFFLHLGVGNNGVTVKKQGDALIVEEKKVPLLGATYARHLTSGFYVGLSGFSNESVTGMVGYTW